MKKFLLLLIVLLGFTCLTACSKKNEVDKEFELISAEDITNYSGTIDISFSVPSGIIYTTLETMIPEFEAEWNGKINVDLVKINEGYDGLRKQTIYDLNAGKAPTMLIGYPDHFAEYYTADGLISLQPYIDAEGEDFIKDFVDAYLPENQISDDNEEYYGLPLNKSTEVLIYNKTVFDAMGYTVPTTWDEVQTLSAKIIEDVGKGDLDDTDINTLGADDTKPSTYLEEGRFYPLAYDSTDNAFITLTRQWGGAYTEKENVIKGYAMFDNTQVKTGLKYFQDMAKAGYFAVAETFDQSYASTAFQNVQCLMTIGSSAGVKYNIKTGENVYEVGVAPIPTNGSNKFVIQQGTNVAILSQSTNLQRAAAWQLIKYLTSTENTVDFAISAGGYFPVRKSGYESDAYKAFLAKTAVVEKKVVGDTEIEIPNETYYYSRAAQVGLDYANKGYTLFVDPAFKGSSTIRDEVGSLFTKVVVGQADIAQAIKDALNTLGPVYQKK